MTHDWRTNAPPPQPFTAETLIEQLRNFEQRDAERVANWKPPPIYVSRDVFNEWVRLGLIDESGKPLPLAKEPSL